MDLAAMPTKPDQTAFANGMAKGARAKGDSVVESDATFAGHGWRHLEIDSPDLGAQDLFILVEQDVMYGILVTQPSREKDLIEAAQKGFRLIPKTTPDE